LKSKLIYKLVNRTSIYYIAFVSIFISFYHQVFFHPNSFLFSSSGDGIKNYFTYNYYIKHNHSIFNFEGINYPYGEHIFYTDSTPILSILIRYIKLIFPSIENYSIGILNWLILFSYILCFHFLFKLFKLLSIEKTLSFIGALGITLLCPQIFRLTGHLALGFSFFIPLSFYYLYQISALKINKINHLSICILIALTTHAYLGFIVFSISFSFITLLLFLNYIDIKSQFRNYLISVLKLISPLLLFNLILFLTDFHIGRTTNPFGFFNYYANFNSFFKPISGGFSPIFSHFLPKEESDWEALNYLGITTILFLPFTFYFLIKNRKKQTSTHQFLKITFLIGIVFLLYSMCIPFKFHLAKLVDLLSILKQFRALGRFGWISFFAFNILCIYILNHLFSKLKSVYIRQSLYICLLGIFLFETTPNHVKIAKQISTTPNYFYPNYFNINSVSSKINQSSFQAIIPFPYYFIGTENHHIPIRNDEIVKNSMLLSYYSGLPLMSNYLSRSSLKEGKNTLQFLGPLQFNKNIQEDIKSTHPFLIYKNDTCLYEFEKNILQFSTKFYDQQNEALYKLKYSTIFNTKIQNQEKHIISNKLIFEGFEKNKQSKIKRNGNSSFIGKMNQYEIIKDINSKLLQSNKTYRVSFWVYNNGKNFGQDEFCQQTFVQTIDNGKANWITDIYSAKNSTSIDGNWTLVSFNFRTTNKKTIYQIVSYGDPLLNTSYIIDDLSIEEIN
jgi:hypothetical protein